MGPHRSDAESLWYPAERNSEWERDARHQAEPEQRHDDDRYRVPEPRGGYDRESEPVRVSRYADLIPDPGTREDVPDVPDTGLDAQTPGTPTIGQRSGEPLPPLPGTSEPSFNGFATATSPAGVLPPRPMPSAPPPPAAASPLSVPPFAEAPLAPPLADPRQHPTETFDRNAVRRSGGPAPIGDGVYRTRRPTLAAILIMATVVLEVAPVRLLVDAILHARSDATVAATLAIIGLPMFALGLYALVGSGSQATGGARAWLRGPLVYLPVALVLFLAAGLAA